LIFTPPLEIAAAVSRMAGWPSWHTVPQS